MTVSRIEVKSSLVDWAFSVTDVNKDAIESVISKFRWLQEDSDTYLKPTIKQLADFAVRLHVPFGNLLLSEPPKTEAMKLAFRTEKNAPAQVSLTVRDVIYEMKRKQAWFREESGLANEKLTFIGSAAGFDRDETLSVVSNLLRLNHFRTARELYSDLRNQFAHLGILNMQKGGAGLGVNRPLDVKEMRAFVLLDDFAPLIFINEEDSYTARVFSLVHEFIHLLHGTDELLSEQENDVVEEQNINKVVAAFLMPEGEFTQRFNKTDVAQVGRYFNASPETVAIRAQEIGLIKNTNEIRLPVVQDKLKKSTGGNPYNTALSLNDQRYMNAVVVAQDSGLVQPTRAASLIGISYKMLDKTVENFNEREATA
ncbi:ImmA/IrrE family metallo-endopeptidase [Furfurilactobacillus milii]|uniref:ImmA/IrrE family metallo-endopeptidase n=1 Tax=Furfurilactobacillus milii TaxID=2888272 RepID=A0A6N9I028_9LACO|nr:ImmA/IrrE family metallo-endopeptidase [Furfurilactobacillus milii]MYV16144.1 ImmA/IrrE family metallo-endopeptidase [Furfurilactobacillus milii]